jgi:glucose-1-phosphate adenylyltransferase
MQTLNADDGMHNALADTLCIIMGGGAGSRLFPLTKDRSKPAVPLGGKYRLVDIPISNCLHSQLRRIFILTQFNSVSLHRHIQNTYRFDPFSPGFVEILAAQQTFGNTHWYQGTADAVRQNMRYFLSHPYKYFLVLSGDQLYRMDFRFVLKDHIERNADLTIATLPVDREDAKGFGIMHTREDGTITEFVEKPQEEKLLDHLRIPKPMLGKLGRDEHEDLYEASMGIYVFNRETLRESLDNDLTDFGKHIIPNAIENKRVFSYIFQGYWADIGSIRSFYDANLDLTNIVPQFSFFESNTPIYTHSRFLPASKINGAHINKAIVSDGCIISSESSIERSLIGIRSIIQNGCQIKNTVIMGADYFPEEDDSEMAQQEDLPRVGIGRNCYIEEAIIDKNARIGDDCVITPHNKPANYDGDNYYIRDGIVVVAKNSVIPSGTKI